MASILARLKHVGNYPWLVRRDYSGLSGAGPLGFVVDKGERYAGALAFGAAKGYYRERFVWKGYGGDLWLGASLTLGSALLQIFSGGRSQIAPHAERLGDAGVMSYLNSIGAAWGNKKAGRIVQVLEGGRPSPALSSAAAAPVLGAIPPAMGGAVLTADEIARYSAPRP